MSDITIAVLSQGLFAGDGANPIPYDVRFGVSYGNGEVGTLTSPTAANVRQGVQYGGDGTQYTGTLSFNSSSGNSWEDDMAEVFEDERSASEYRAALVYNGSTIYGVKMALSVGFQMQTTGYSRKADTAFDALRTDVEGIGLYDKCANRNPSVIRPTVTVNGESFMVLDLKDDIATDPTVKLILSALQ